MSTLIAQIANDIGGSFNGIGPLGNTGSYMGNIRDTTSLFNRLMSIIIGFLTVVAGLFFIFQFLTGAISYLSAGGDESKIKASQSKITQAVVGLAITVVAIFLIDFIGTLLGLKILTPGDFIINIW